MGANHEEQQYEKICKDRFDDIIVAVGRIEKRLFYDNGTECLQSKINRHDRWIKWVAFVVASISTGMFGVAIWAIKAYLTKTM